MKKNKSIILTYHSIEKSLRGEIGAGLYCISEERFRQQMKYLKDRPCGITFDDGHITNYDYAFPILKEFDLQAYFFIIASRVGQSGYMNWQQLNELKENGMIIGSHGMAHRILAGLSDVELDYELKESKKILEANLGRPIDYFSLPRGFSNKRIENKAREAGYKEIFTSNYNDDDGFKAGRIAVKRNWNLPYFIKVINNGISLKDRAGMFARETAKNLLGIKSYDRIRTRILRNS